MAIEFRFHPEKVVEAVAFLLKLHGKPIEYLGLLKMLYIADRITLQRMDQSITGDHYVSMNYGPVLSGVYDLIKGKPVNDALPLWSNYIASHDEHCITLLNDPGNGELCEEEEEILQEVYQKFGQINRFQVAELTDYFPEWKYPNGSAIPISVEDILRNVGKSEEEIEEIQHETEREAYLDGVLSVY